MSIILQSYVQTVGIVHLRTKTTEFVLFCAQTLTNFNSF
jgi:hypothetical protein